MTNRPLCRFAERTTAEPRRRPAGAAERAERAYALLSERIAPAPGGRIQLLLTDHADFSNGFATPVPFNRITIYARPPIDGGSLAYFDDWLELVITHELVHTFHFEMAGTAGKVIRAVMGRLPTAWPVFPSAAAPTWMSEGLATYFESGFTGAGRAKGTWQEMVMRAASLEGALAPHAAAADSGASPACACASTLPPPPATLGPSRRSRAYAEAPPRVLRQQRRSETGLQRVRRQSQHPLPHLRRQRPVRPPAPQPVDCSTVALRLEPAHQTPKVASRHPQPCRPRRRRQHPLVHLPQNRYAVSLLTLNSIRSSPGSRSASDRT